jgi:hypothetical protein
VKSLDRTDKRAICITAVDAWFSDDIGHFELGSLNRSEKFGEES